MASTTAAKRSNGNGSRSSAASEPGKRRGRRIAKRVNLPDPPLKSPTSTDDPPEIVLSRSVAELAAILEVAEISAPSASRLRQGQARLNAAALDVYPDLIHPEESNEDAIGLSIGS